MHSLPWAAQVRRTPLALLVVALGAVGALVVDWWPQAVHWFTLQDFHAIDGGRAGFESFATMQEEGQYWRLLTPVFLHFGLLHIVFNGLWVWEFGRRIELQSGSLGFLLLFVVVAVGSNVGQYLWSGPTLFGGLSGVVYGLLGYIWLRGLLAPDPLLWMPRSIIVFMLVWLVLCLVGVIDLFLDGGVANGAHVAGLTIGAALGILAGLRHGKLWGRGQT